jgi:hypothetical protein
VLLESEESLTVTGTGYAPGDEAYEGETTPGPSTTNAPGGAAADAAANRAFAIVATAMLALTLVAF